METVNFKCGHCGNLMGVGTAYLGQQVRCPHCQQVVVAPAAAPPSLDATLQLGSSHSPSGLEKTSFLSSPSSNDPASLISEGSQTSDLFLGPAPPGLEMPATVQLDPPAAPRVSDVDATLAYEPSPGSSPSSAEIPDWMKPVASPGLPPAADGIVSELPAPPPVKAPRGGMSLGMLLFISLVFMPLVLYSILATVLAILFWNQSSNPATPPDPREFLIDSEGDHPGAKKGKMSGRQLETDVKFATKPLTDSLRIKLGDTLTLGDLRVKAEGVDHRVIKMRTPGFDKPDPIETLALRLHLTNMSKEVSFYPMDCYFDRNWRSGKGFPPLTVLMAGDKLRFFGGPAVWNRGPISSKDNPEHRNFIIGNNYEKPLNPGDEMDTFVCIDGRDSRWEELAQYKGPLVWHVHVRRGLVHWKDRDYSATAVVGVEFTNQDIKQVN